MLVILTSLARTFRDLQSTDDTCELFEELRAEIDLGLMRLIVLNCEVFQRTEKPNVFCLLGIWINICPGYNTYRPNK